MQMHFTSLTGCSEPVWHFTPPHPGQSFGRQRPRPAQPFRAVLALLALLLPLSFSHGATPRKPVINEYHGVKVIDEYQWLENGSAPAVRQWTASQNRKARGYLDKLPTRPALEYHFNKLFATVSANYSDLKVRGGTVFAMKFKPPAQQAVLVTMRSPNDVKSEKAAIDPNLLDPQGGTSIDFYEPSVDGKLIAVSLSEQGSEAGTLYVFEADTGRKRADVIPRVQFPTAGGSVAWNADGSGFFYTRYPRPGERPAADERFYQQVYFHKLGDPADQDRYEIGRDFPRIAEIQLKTSDDARHLLASVENGDGEDFAHYVRLPDGKWRQVAGFQDQVKRAEFGRDPLYIEWPKDDALYLLSRKDAPRGRILKLPLAAANLSQAREVIKQTTNVIASFVPSASGLYIEDMNGGPSTIRFHDFYVKGEPNADESDDDADNADSATNENATPAEGDQNAATTTQPEEQQERRGRSGRRERAPRKEFRLPLRGTYSVEEMLCRRGDEILFRTVEYTEPYLWQTFDPNRDRNRVNPTDLKGVAPADFRDVEVKREFAVSKDGTKVPMSIIQRKGTRRNGQNPAILTGYGGYGISRTPQFDFTRRIWLDQGGLVVVANLRGGGEYGEEWHKAGNLTKKQNVFDDFIACAEFLIRSNYTSAGKLAIQGGSNGGLLMGAALTQRPDLFRAVVAHVGIYDMLRVELDPNGEFNTTEFGTVKKLDQFQALSAYSPYHRLVNKTAYPPVLLLTGEHDGRVNPAHSRKMAARLQAASTTKEPALLRTSSSSGHGIGTALNERMAQLVDVYAFLFDRLGIEYSEVARGPWVGAVTTNSAWVKARLGRESQSARLVLSNNPLLTRPRYSAPVRSATNHYNVVAFPTEHLKPDTQYYYALEVDGKLDRTKRGKFRTFPENPTSFSFAFASCARTASTSDVFDVIRDNNPLFFMNIGDFHYLDLTNSTVDKFRAAYDLVLTSPQQAELYRSVAFNYIWDDHDFGGNNSNRRSTSHEAVRMAYHEYVPHYPLALGVGDVPICHSFNVGRVKFILTDLRSERDSVTNKDDANKSMLGARQKAWFKQELLSSNGKFPLIFWVTSVPWLGERGTNYYRVATNVFGYLHHTNLPPQTASTRTNSNRGGRGGRGGGRVSGVDDQDHWSVYSTERREICDFIKANHIQGVAILHGDSHMLAADDGSHSDFATGGGVRIPVMCGGPLDQNPSLKGGPYSQGVYRVRPGEGGFGFITVTDRGEEIDVRYRGLNNKNEEKISLRFKVPVSKTLATARGN